MNHKPRMTTQDIVRRRDQHAESADLHGHYTIANTLYLAAREIERMIREQQFASSLRQNLPTGYAGLEAEIERMNKQ
jgi:hypothetical protein